MVIMVGHQVVGITHPPHTPTNVTESLEKDVSALLVQVNISSTITTRRDMIHRVWELYAEWSRHAGEYSLPMW
jgi:hypothetical protein